ncbi:MAG: hypothetical protein RJQ04_01085 [Longimicrobiales bacterium]
MWLNGAEIMGPSDLSGTNRTSFSRDIELPAGTSVLDLRMAGKPGDRVRVTVEARPVVPDAGIALLDLPDIGTLVAIPDGTLFSLQGQPTPEDGLLVGWHRPGAADEPTIYTLDTDLLPASFFDGEYYAQFADWNLESGLPSADLFLPSGKIVRVTFPEEFGGLFKAPTPTLETPSPAAPSNVDDELQPIKAALLSAAAFECVEGLINSPTSTREAYLVDIATDCTGAALDLLGISLDATDRAALEAWTGVARIAVDALSCASGSLTACLQLPFTITTTIYDLAAPDAVYLVNGDGSEGYSGTTLPLLRIAVVNKNGSLLNGIWHAWSVTDGSAVLANGNTLDRKVTSTGYSTNVATLGEDAGPVTVRVTTRLFRAVSAEFRLLNLGPESTTPNICSLPSLDFTGNVAPALYSVRLRRRVAGPVNERIEVPPVDGVLFYETPASFDTPTGAVQIEFDMDTEPATFGDGAQVLFFNEDETERRQLTVFAGDSYRNLQNNLVVRINDEVLSGPNPGQFIDRLVEPFTYQPLHIRLDITESEVRILATSLDDGSVVMDDVLNGGVPFDRMTKIAFGSNTTTQATTWSDNWTFACGTYEPPASPLGFVDTFDDGDLFDDWTWFSYTTGLHGPVLEPSIVDGEASILTRDQQQSMLYRPTDGLGSQYSAEMVVRVDRLYDDVAGQIQFQFGLTRFEYRASDGAVDYDGYSLDLRRRDRIWFLRRRNGGEATVVASGPTSIELGLDYRIRVEVRGSRVLAYFQPEDAAPALLLDVDVGTPIAGSGIAIGGGDDEIRVDEVRVESAS